MTDNPPVIYKFGYGIVSAKFAAPGGAGARGLAYSLLSPDNIYVSNYETSWVYRTTTTGSIITSFRCPYDGPGDPEFDVDGSLYVPFPALNLIARMNTVGSLLNTFPGPGSRPEAAASFGTYYVGDTITHTIYLGNNPIWTGIKAPVAFGMCVGVGPPPPFVLLYILDDASDYLYVLSYDYEEARGPASLGRVKALFK